MIPMESLVVCTSQKGAGNTFNSVGDAYRNRVARPFEDKIRVAEIYLEMREINPDVSIRAVSLAASVGKYFATKVLTCSLLCTALSATNWPYSSLTSTSSSS